MITQEERLQLFKDCGMTQMVKKIEEEKKMLAEAAELTAMKFKATTVSEIREKICGEYWSSNPRDGGLLVLAPFMACVTGFLAGCAVHLIYHHVLGFGLDTPFKQIIPGIFSGGFGGIVFDVFLFKRTSELEVMNLWQWKDNIPTGALLAVKEAQEKGLEEFKIYFPITQERMRLKTDPVIVGFRKSDRAPKTQVQEDNSFNAYMLARIASSAAFRGETSESRTMIEVFAWDDGQIYE